MSVAAHELLFLPFVGRKSHLHLEAAEAVNKYSSLNTLKSELGYFTALSLFQDVSQD